MNISKIISTDKNNQTPLVSVIIATYNRAEFISRCLDSVLMQKHVDTEIFVVDDCSTDNTSEVLARYSSSITLLKNEKNMGISFNSNLGFSKCNGEYICMLGDDDFWTDSSKLASQVAKFKEDKSLGISTTWWHEFDSNSGSKIPKLPVYPKNLKERVLSGGGLICGSAVMIARKAWLTVDGFDELKRRGTDSDFFRRIVLAGYDVSIIEAFMVSVDVTPGRTRMTELVSASRIQTHIDSLLYTLSKHEAEYALYPNAKATYYEKLGWLYEQKYNHVAEGGNESIKYYWLSLSLQPLKLLNMIRLTRIVFRMAIKRVYK
jgi:glycosyltransferase involved in cell wall biosynthesis